MADEISQVVEMEFKGTYYLFKGTKAFIAYVGKLLTQLMEWQNEKYLKKPGNCTLEKIQTISEGTPPILEFPKEMFETPVVGKDAKGNVIFGKSEFDMYCETHNLRYCIMPDLNPNDDYIPVAVPTQDMGIHQEMIKAVMTRRILDEENKDKDYDAKIVAVKEKILNAKTDEEKVEAEAELKALEEAKAQNKELLAESKAKADRDNVLDFAEYLKQGEGTLLESDPELALKQVNECGFVKEYKAYDCMWPVREAEMVPESGNLYYSQTTKDSEVHYIRREFKTDDHGQIYSEYFVKMPGTSSEKIFSDFGLSREDWEKQIPNVLAAAGLQNDEPMAVVQTKERFAKYREFVEENFKRAREESSGEVKEKTYSSEQAKEYVEDHNKSQKETVDFEESMYTILTVDSSKLLYDEEEVLCVETKDGLLRGAMVDHIDEKSADVFIKPDCNYTLVTADGRKSEVSGATIIDRNSNVVADAAKVMRKGR